MCPVALRAVVDEVGLGSETIVTVQAYQYEVLAGFDWGVNIHSMRLRSPRFEWRETYGHEEANVLRDVARCLGQTGILPTYVPECR